MLDFYSIPSVESSSQAELVFSAMSQQLELLFWANVCPLNLHGDMPKVPLVLAIPLFRIRIVYGARPGDKPLPERGQWNNQEFHEARPREPKQVCVLEMDGSLRACNRIRFLASVCGEADHRHTLRNISESPGFSFGLE